MRRTAFLLQFLEGNQEIFLQQQNISSQPFIRRSIQWVPPLNLLQRLISAVTARTPHSALIAPSGTGLGDAVTVTQYWCTFEAVSDRVGLRVVALSTETNSNLLHASDRFRTRALISAISTLPSNAARVGATFTSVTGLHVHHWCATWASSHVRFSGTSLSRLNPYIVRGWLWQLREIEEFD